MLSKKDEDIVNDKYEILNDQYAFLVDLDENGFYIKYCHNENILKEGTRGKDISSLVELGYSNHLKLNK